MEDLESNPALKAFAPEIGIVLGSGLGSFVEDRVEVEAALAYSEIPGFPVSTVPGHAGRFVLGHLGGRRVVCMQGRVHFYEGYSLREVTLPIRLMARWGIRSLLLTNAAGGINPDFRVGDFMRIRDHINFLGSNPLIGPNADGGERFPDMSEVYDRELAATLHAVADDLKIDLKAGVYLATTGPSFETPAEIRAFHTLGADAVGMSTVPEAIVARHLGLRVAGISCISNAAAGLAEGPLSHEEVGQTTANVREPFAELISGFVAAL